MRPDICNGCEAGWASYDGKEFKSCMDTECDRKKRNELFGSWVESGNEDRHFEELRKSRLVPSAEVF